MVVWVPRTFIAVIVGLVGLYFVVRGALSFRQRDRGGLPFARFELALGVLALGAALYLWLN